MSLQKCLEELPSLDKPLVQSRLVHLSNLEPEEMSAFIEAWPAMTTDRRRKAISMLVELAEDNVELDFNSLFRHTLDDDDEEVRAVSIAGLWECEERSLIDPLIRLMNDDSEETVRAAAARALGRFALLAETGKLLERDHGRIGEALLAVIDTDGETVEVHRRAIEAVAPMSLPRVSEVIQEAYEDGDPKLVGSALCAMGLNCDPKWLPILLQELENEDNEVRYEAVGAISEVGGEEVVPRLVPLILDSDPQVQAAAISALGAIGGPTAKTVLGQAIRNPDPRLGELAETALQSMDFDENPPDLRVRR